MPFINITCPKCGGQAQIEAGRSAMCPYCACELNAAAPDPGFAFAEDMQFAENLRAAENMQFAQDVQFAQAPVQQPVQMQQPNAYASPQINPAQFINPAMPYQQPVQQYQQPVQAQYSQQPQYQQQTQQANMQVAAGAGGMAAATQSAQWQCPICGMPGNTGNFCEGCGSRRP